MPFLPLCLCASARAKPDLRTSAEARAEPRTGTRRAKIDDGPRIRRGPGRQPQPHACQDLRRAGRGDRGGVRGGGGGLRGARVRAKVAAVRGAGDSGGGDPGPARLRPARAGAGGALLRPRGGGRAGHRGGGGAHDGAAARERDAGGRGDARGRGAGRVEGRPVFTGEVSTRGGAFAGSPPCSWTRRRRREPATGGHGEAFDWDALAAVDRAGLPPLWLAGGLTPANVAEAIGVVRPFGVDVSSGVEAAKGVKDAGEVRRFVTAAGSVPA